MHIIQSKYNNIGATSQNGISKAESLTDQDLLPEKKNIYDGVIGVELIAISTHNPNNPSMEKNHQKQHKYARFKPNYEIFDQQ